MRRTGFFLLLVWLWSWAAASVAELSRPALWQADTDGREVWLFGSLHYGEPGFYPLPVEVTEAFEQADLLAVEINLLDIDPLAVGRRIMTEGMYTGLDNNLRHNIDPDSWRQLQAVADEFGLPIEMLQQQKPWLVAMTLSSQMYRRVGLSEQHGLDMHFLNLAREQGKSIVELEGMDLQFDLFQHLDADTQRELLRLTLDQLEEGKMQLRQLIAAWRDGDEQQLNRQINNLMQADAGSELLHRLLLTERNRTMAATIDELAAEGVVFVVVGAGHLVGERSVQHYLERYGYRIRRR